MANLDNIPMDKSLYTCNKMTLVLTKVEAVSVSLLEKRLNFAELKSNQQNV